jgi:hypothetical protein
MRAPKEKDMSEASLKPVAPAGFRFFSMGKAARLILAGGCFALGAALQLTVGVLPGVLLIIAGWVPLMLRRVTNKPKDQGLEDWRPVSSAEVDRLLDTFSQARQMRRKLGGSTATRMMGLVGGFVVLMILLSIFPLSGGIGLVLLDAILFLVPALFFGTISVFVPELISMKLGRFQAILAESAPTGFALTPYIRFDKDEEGRDVPEDLRFLLEPKKKNDDLVGVQFQVAINKGPNGPVPYMYAVALTRGRKGVAYESLKGFSARGYEVERGGDDKYGTVVIRQRTSGGGYHTTDEDCRRLFQTASAAVSAL